MASSITAGSKARRFRSRDLTRWLHTLQRRGFLKRETGRLLTLNVPLLVRLSEEVIDRLHRVYLPDTETGGLLLAEPLLEDSQKVLQVDRMRLLRNVSDNPYSTYSAENLCDNVEKALRGTKGGLHYLPVEFHTHPQPMGPEGRSREYPLASMWQLQTSERDRKNATRAYGIIPPRVRLLLPRALVYPLEKELFIGFYGGEIAPPGFEEYARKLILDRAVQIAEGMMTWALAGEKWKVALAFLASVGVMSISSLALLDPRLRMEMARDILNLREETKACSYFVFVEKGPVKILIP